MQRTLILTLLLPLSVAGTNCGAGRKALADLTGLTCSLSGSDAASCDSNCCEDNKLTCGGIGVACDFDSYAAGGDAWKAKATTKDTKTTDCCTKKAKCGAAPTCPAGYKAKTGVADVMCATDAKSCEDDTCCEKDTTTCGGATAVACDAGKYVGSDDSWKKTPLNGKAFKDACCEASPTCASTGYSCAAGYVRDDANKAEVCKTDVKSCATEDVIGSTKKCCKASGCGQFAAGSITCTTGYQSTDAWVLNQKAVAGDKAKLVADKGCCVPQATCASAVCPAGSKMKAGAGVPKELCPKDAASCNTLPGTCCESDVTKCGGLTGITCPYGYYDESTFFVTTGDKDKQTAKAVVDAWMNKPATDATKNTACCTAKAMCSGGAMVTTTPAATATPATPVRRYSANKLTQETSSSSANMVWLFVGGFIGMASLMAVQGLRSRMQAAPQERDTYSNVE